MRLILPSWFYEDVNNHNLLNKTQHRPASPHPSSTMSARNNYQPPSGAASGTGSALHQSLKKAFALKHLQRKAKPASQATMQQDSENVWKNYVLHATQESSAASASHQKVTKKKVTGLMRKERGDPRHIAVSCTNWQRRRHTEVRHADVS